MLFKHWSTIYVCLVIKGAVIVLLVITGACLIFVSADVCEKYDVNGCSIPFRLPFFYKRRFTPSCNRHDVCYRCGQRFRIPKRTCDETFHAHMRQSCATKRGISRRLCYFFAKGYYKMVKRFGQRRYRVPAKWYCGQSWVPSCLP